MYIPKFFEETDKEKILALANEYAFATLVTVSEDGEPIASHLPLLIEDKGNIIITGHMARANEQWQHFHSANEVMVIFQGPHAYISPSNYEDSGVPTWNYIAIHMYGTCRVVDAQQTMKMVEDLTEKYEKSQALPWSPEYPVHMLAAIVGFEIEVSRVEAKSKLSQNKSEIDRKNIITNLRQSSNDLTKAMADFMSQAERLA